jgi:hypothetical protein
MLRAIAHQDIKVLFLLAFRSGTRGFENIRKLRVQAVSARVCIGLAELGLLSSVALRDAHDFAIGA